MYLKKCIYFLTFYEIPNNIQQLQLITFICSLLLLCDRPVFAQNLADLDLQALKMAYEESNTSMLYNGPEYISYERHIYENHHPFYKQKQYYFGTIWSRGHEFIHTELCYDLVKDLVVIPNKYDGYYHGVIALVTATVDSFFLDRRMFIRLDNINKRSGFYARLNDGKCILWAKYSKQYAEQVSIPGENISWNTISDQAATYYLEIHGNIYRVNDVKEIGRLMNVPKKIYKQFIKLKIDGEKESVFIAATQYFENFL